VMATVRPGRKCRPHVKAHKSSALAKMQVTAGHEALTCATAREALGLAEAGLGEDILLANELVDAVRLEALARADARITVVVDSEETLRAAAKAGLRECVIDVDVGLHRCGCFPHDAGRLAEHAAAVGLSVRGVMGYEGHAVGIRDRAERERLTCEAMELLLVAHAEVGGDMITAGGTGTYDYNRWASEIQAGSYLLMDTAYDALELPFRRALSVLTTVISVSPDWAVGDCGLKALGMDHGPPTIEGATVLRCSDEHITFVPEAKVAVGDRAFVWPAHIDPTVAYHEALWVVTPDEVIDQLPVDLRGW